MSYRTIDFVHPALDLMNSQHGRGPDLLHDSAWLDAYLIRWGYSTAGALSERERNGIVALRALMRRIVETLDEGGTPSPTDLARLNGFLGGAKMSRAIEAERQAFELRLVPVRQDWTWVRSEIASALGQLLAGGETDRLKVCDNPDCRFAFYDGSKNRSRRWCSHTTCGNRDKLKRFRARQRERDRGGTRYSASR